MPQQQIQRIVLRQINDAKMEVKLHYASTTERSGYKISINSLRQMCDAMASKNKLIFLPSVERIAVELAHDLSVFAQNLVNQNADLKLLAPDVWFLTISRFILRLDKINPKLAIQLLDKYLNDKNLDATAKELEYKKTHLHYIVLHRNISNELTEKINDILDPLNLLSQFNIGSHPSVIFSRSLSTSSVQTGAFKRSSTQAKYTNKPFVSE